MVTHGWIEDDNCEFMIPSFKSYSYDKEKPGVIIEIINEKNAKRKSKTTNIKNKTSPIK